MAKAKYNFKGKQVFKYIQDVDSDLKLRIEAVQELTMEKVMQELLLIIKKDVYGRTRKRNPNRFYHRTHSLMKIWDYSEPYYHGGSFGGVYGGIIADENKFERFINDNPDSTNKGWQHANPEMDYYDEISAKDFVNIINGGANNPLSIFEDTPRTEFWDDFIDFMEKEYVKIFRETAIENGLPLTGMTGIGSINKSGSITGKSVKPSIRKK